MFRIVKYGVWVLSIVRVVCIMFIMCVNVWFMCINNWCGGGWYFIDVSGDGGCVRFGDGGAV